MKAIKQRETFSLTCIALVTLMVMTTEAAIACQPGQPSTTLSRRDVAVRDFDDQHLESEGFSLIRMKVVAARVPEFIEKGQTQWSGSLDIQVIETISGPPVENKVYVYDFDGYRSGCDGLGRIRIISGVGEERYFIGKIDSDGRVISRKFSSGASLAF